MVFASIAGQKERYTLNQFLGIVLVRTIVCKHFGRASNKTTNRERKRRGWPRCTEQRVWLDEDKGKRTESDEKQRKGREKIN